MYDILGFIDGVLVTNMNNMLEKNKYAEHIRNSYIVSEIPLICSTYLLLSPNMKGILVYLS